MEFRSYDLRDDCGGWSFLYRRWILTVCISFLSLVWPPFRYQLILNADVDYSQWFSPEATSFVSGLLDRDPKTRLTIPQLKVLIIGIRFWYTATPMAERYRLEESREERSHPAFYSSHNFRGRLVSNERRVVERGTSKENLLISTFPGSKPFFAGWR